jgi:hypothetical protein
MSAKSPEKWYSGKGGDTPGADKWQALPGVFWLFWCSGSQALLGNPSLGSSASRFCTIPRQAELARLRSQAELGNENNEREYPSK